MPAAPTDRRILIVDDEENVCHALRRSLRREGYGMTIANHPHEALKLVSQQAFDLVISDHLMPDLTGLEFLKLVHDRQPDAIRIMLTGHADMQTAIAAINQGEIYRFLTKPWDDMDLKVTLHLAFEQLDLTRENRRLLALVRKHQALIQELEAEHPAIRSMVRDSSGAFLIDADLELTADEVRALQLNDQVAA